jgi:hypothetical protein
LGNFIHNMYLELTAGGVKDTNFVLHHYDAIPSRLTRNHDVAMSRLEMYSTTTCICLGLAMLTPILLLMPGVGKGGTEPPWVALLGAVLYALLALLNYAAALRAADFLKRSLSTIRKTLADSGHQL